MSNIETRQGIVKAEQISKDDMFFFYISKNEVELKATYRLERQIKELMKSGINGKNSLVLCFMGYDSDRREVYQIPEICTFLRTLFTNVPELFYFLNINSYTYAICVNAIFTDQKQVNLADSAMEKYAKSIGDTGRVITVEYYVQHHQELTKRG